MHLKYRAAKIVALTAIVLSASPVFGQAFIEHVWPAAVAPGQTTRVKIVGSQLNGTVGLWTSLPKGSYSIDHVGKSEDSHATFDLTLKHSIPTGLYGIRVATRDGLSNVHLIAVDDLPTVAERETIDPKKSNNDVTSPQLCRLPAAVVGICDKEDIDHFQIDVKAGQRVSFEIVGNRLGKGFDPVITIYDSNGEEVASRDNDQGLFFDCRFAKTFKKAGRYTLSLHDSRYLGSRHWTYVLRVGRFPEARVALPSAGPSGSDAVLHLPQLGSTKHAIKVPTGMRTNERFYVSLRRSGDDGSAWIPYTISNAGSTIEVEPNDDDAKATFSQVPADIHGIVNKSNDVDSYAIDLKKGQRIMIRTETRGMGSPADLEVSVIGPNGKRIKAVDDVGFEDAVVEFSAAADGRHFIRTRDVVGKGGRSYVYRLEVRFRKPQFELLSEIGRIAIPQDSWQPLPLKLTRRDFNGIIRLELDGVPEGVRLKENIIAEGQNDWIGAIQVSPDARPGVYTLQVRGYSYDHATELTTTATTQPLIDRLPTGRGPHGEPFELREDQRRLPPSITDKIALVILPPAPFEFELPDAETVLPRYVYSTFPIRTIRKNGYAEPIQYEARGGLLEYNRLQKPSVNASIPEAPKGSETRIKGTLTSGVNTTITSHRVTVTATTKTKQGRTINLTRTFQLKIVPAFQPSAEPAKVTLKPGESTVVKLLAGRVEPYQNLLRLNPEKLEGFTFPTEFEFKRGVRSKLMKIGVDKATKPGKYKINIPSSAKIDKFYEQTPSLNIEVEVK